MLNMGILVLRNGSENTDRMFGFVDRMRGVFGEERKYILIVKMPGCPFQANEECVS